MAIGEQLRNARIQRGLTVQDVAQQTFIRAHYIEAIENGEFDVVPPSRLRYFASDYARAVGLNPDEVVAQLPRTVAPTPVAAAPPSKAVAPAAAKRILKERAPKERAPKERPAKREKGADADPGEPRRRRPRYQPISQGNPTLVRALMVVAALLIGGLAVYYFLGGFDDDPASSAGLSDTTEIGGETTILTLDGEESDTGAADSTLGEVPAGDSLTLEGRAISDVWYSVSMDESRDDAREESGLMDSGTTKTWRAVEEFSVSLGNAGGLELYLNGKPIGKLGRPGRAVRGKIITAEGIKQPSQGSTVTPTAPATATQSRQTRTTTPRRRVRRQQPRTVPRVNATELRQSTPPSSE